MKSLVLPATLFSLTACSPATNAASPITEAPPKITKVQGNWVMDPVKSSLKFSAVQTGTVFKGEFKNFDAIINFDPAEIDAASVIATIDMSSFDAGDSERNNALPSKDWFFVKNFPEATFVTDAFSDLGGGLFEVEGILTLRGVSKPLTFPVSIDIQDETALMSGGITLNRKDYGVGQGAWATDEWVSLEVQLDINITATR